MASSPEHAIQCAYFRWARQHPVARRAFAVPNGGHRHIRVAAKLKAEGVRAGVLDVLLPVARGGAHSLWIEFKAGRNRPTPEQEAEAAALREDGFTVLMTNSLDEALAVTADYLDGKVGPELIVRWERPAPAKRAARASAR